MRIVGVPLIPQRELRTFRRRLLAWFARRKRDLPWRRTKDAYRIWLSEIMLQQTRVAAVIPYYERFLAKYPNVGTLARAKCERVLANWAGLGYYSRATNLHRAAKEIVARHAGHFPRDHEAALSLPGVGRYTAAAVLSIAYDQPRAVVDGNVARVLARLGARHRGDVDPRAPGVWRAFEAVAGDLLAQSAPGDWNQAMMELGATVCTPKSPRCRECPASQWCRARRLGIVEMLPTARRKPATIEVTLAATVLLDPRRRTLLVRGSSGEGVLFSRMWQFPALQTTGADARELLVAHLRDNLGLEVNGNFTPLAAARHTVTFRKIRLEPFLLHLARLPRVKGARIVPLTRFRGLPVSNATRKIADAAIAHLEKIARAPRRANSLSPLPDRPHRGSRGP